MCELCQVDEEVRGALNAHDGNGEERGIHAHHHCVEVEAERRRKKSQQRSVHALDHHFSLRLSEGRRMEQARSSLPFSTISSTVMPAHTSTSAARWSGTSSTSGSTRRSRMPQ